MNNIKISDFDFRSEIKKLNENSNFKLLSQLFIIRKARQVTESSIAIYHQRINKHMLPFFGDMKIKDIDTYDLEEFARQKEEHLGEASVRDMVNLFINIMQFAKQQGIIINEFEKVKINFQSGKKEVEIFTEEECLRMKNSEDIYSKVIFNLLIDTGMRIGELCALKWEDIDMEKRLIHVNKTMQRVCIPGKSHVIVTPPKSKSGIRSIPMTLNLVLLLEKLVDEYDHNTYILGSLKNVEKIEPRSCRYSYSTALKKLGIPYRKVHTTRHTFATKLCKNTTDYKSVSKILGHSSIETTLNTYVHSSKDDISNLIFNMN